MKRQAIGRAREIGSRAAARELGIDVKTLRGWRRDENRGLTPDDAAALTEIDELERALPTADYHTVQRIKARIENLSRDAGIDVYTLLSR